jgi:hypothetical protein
MSPKQKSRLGWYVFLFVLLPSVFLIPCIVNGINRCGSQKAEAASSSWQSPPLLDTVEHPPDIVDKDFPGIGREHRRILVEQRTLVQRAVRQVESIEDSVPGPIE